MRLDNIKEAVRKIHPFTQIDVEEEIKITLDHYSQQMWDLLALAQLFSTRNILERRSPEGSLIVISDWTWSEPAGGS